VTHGARSVPAVVRNAATGRVRTSKESAMYPFDQNNEQHYQQYAQAVDSGDYS